ncbi:hypothetical protein [Mesorhizobium temperatum]|uniref:Apea-like HEPN domain-containing protein n=1 Tax=Mesorhizobium temperatum TaxID=241416 RepID=A0A271LBH2_9HYPH|nr:hypothetical protein [Mesorhizobium temperatum]PAQ05489.1 hypothetical protein CIT26_30805 [Mesorhizobium temperatum]
MPSELERIIAELCGTPRSTDNPFAHPAFLRVVDYCKATYPNAGSKLWLTMAISDALRSLGIHFREATAKLEGALSPTAAAEALHLAFTAPTARRVHLCPLDWAENPPDVVFGRSSMRRFSEKELMDLAEADRIQRTFPSSKVDWKRLSRFHWLIVEEDIPLIAEPGARALPIMYKPLKRDLGAFLPHQGRFPEAVEEALFLMLLAPWEDWAEVPEVDWRGFRVPWIYTADRDLFVRMQAPPQDASLTWLPVAFTDVYGETHEEDQPAHYTLADEASGLPTMVNQSLWEDWLIASKTPLLAAPVAHFLVRAFLSDHIDEFLAHLMVVEASLGLKADYGPKQKGNLHNNLRPTDRMVRRIGKLLCDSVAGEEYRHLFDVRSNYVHGRQMGEISSADLKSARTMARKIAARLIQVAAHDTAATNREAYLVSLLD